VTPSKNKHPALSSARNALSTELSLLSAYRCSHCGTGDNIDDMYKALPMLPSIACGRSCARSLTHSNSASLAHSTSASLAHSRKLSLTRSLNLSLARSLNSYVHTQLSLTHGRKPPKQAERTLTEDQCVFFTSPRGSSNTCGMHVRTHHVHTHTRTHALCSTRTAPLSTSWLG
jgi:hypothetical protein